MEQRLNINVLSLDLELNQPSNNIIQIGAVVGNLNTGEILEKLSCFVQLPNGEVVSEYITKLTNITQEHLNEEGMPLREAYSKLAAMHKRHKCFLNPVTWGGSDSLLLKEQLEREGKLESWTFGRRWLDVKSTYQLFRLFKGEKPQSGLVKSLNRLGINFRGTKHRADDDAEMTFVLLHHLLKTQLKE